ncbi:hypothetical protein CN378_12425 [Bacillus sp. AFS015802]|uniref:hypothetical protein n=1 Tax=Bacillus sp. AFS015802 TaxID=2033486 RepID=UPI000BF27447|nr:hypothetical protein [Bacillus sp. AFS015802]PFA66909.1 hypothetical protein CN378_12425 [Bacillus sp. AFS015802]
MHKEVKLIRGLRQPSYFFYQLKETEVLRGYKQKIFLVFLLSALVFGLISSFGIGMDPLSKELTELSPINFEMEKFLFLLGRIISGIVYAALILFVPALIFWTISDEGEYRKLVITQSLVLIVLLIERLTYIPLSLFLSLDWFSSPLSLGVIAQYITGTSWVIYFLGTISLFKIWVFYIQYKGVKRLTGQKNWLIWLVILLTNVLFWGVTAFLAFLDFSTLL